MDSSPITTTRILRESKTILLTNCTHFVTLSLFYLPICYLFTTNQLSTIYQKPQITSILLILLVNLSALCAGATITYSTHHAFLGEPITFSTTFNSLTSSLLPLLWTLIVANVLVFLTTLTLLMLVSVILISFQVLGLDVFNYYSSWWFPLVVSVVFVVIMTYFQTIWSLASAVVVVESKTGLAALKRSAYLVTGMRSVSFLILLYFGVFSGLMVYICSANYGYGIRGEPLGFITIMGSVFIMMICLRSTSANAVLYNYCKALHDEILPLKVAQGETGYEYDSLPFDYEKVATRDVTVFVA